MLIERQYLEFQLSRRGYESFVVRGEAGGLPLFRDELQRCEVQRVERSDLQLRKYVEGSRAYLERGERLQRGERLRGLELLDEAIALDSSFAMAWRRESIFFPTWAPIGLREVERLIGRSVVS